jgi:hypothetical protein
MPRDTAPRDEPDFTPPPGRRPEHRPLSVRLAWFFGLWAASVSSLALVAFAIRRAMGL